MLPDQVLSTETIFGAFLSPKSVPKEPLVDYEMGGADIQNPSEGLQVKVWKGVYEGGDIILSASGVAPVSVLTVANVVEFAFTFDQSMRHFVTYTLANGDAKFYWYDSLIADYTTTALPSGTMNPRCVLDDKRALQGGTSDIILTYLRAGNLYFRAQRERYLTEHLLMAGTIGRLGQVGMNNKNRLQFEFRGG